MPPNNLHSPRWLEDRCSLRRHLLRRWLRGRLEGKGWRRRLEEEDASGGGGWRRRLEEEAGGDESGWRGVDSTAAADELFSKQPLTCISTHHP